MFYLAWLLPFPGLVCAHASRWKDHKVQHNGLALLFPMASRLQFSIQRICSVNECLNANFVERKKCHAYHLLCHICHFFFLRSNPKFRNRLFVNQIHAFVSACNFALSLMPCLHQNLPIGFFRNLLLNMHNWAYHLLVSLLWFQSSSKLELRLCLKTPKS